ncbi:MAG TPA: hypothetical protein VJN66_04015, partial [Rhodanobacteraceae bacterium]|nr:hypothetical protein [Rhodanobacteraceae bacterium]
VVVRPNVAVDEAVVLLEVVQGRGVLGHGKGFRGGGVGNTDTPSSRPWVGRDPVPWMESTGFRPSPE